MGNKHFIQSFFYSRKRRIKKVMERKIVNIKENLVKEPDFINFEREGEEIKVVNFRQVKNYGKGNEYYNSLAYGDK